MPKLRESLTLVLLTLLPFHAFLVTVVTRVLIGPGHAPIGALALWKEALLIGIVVIALTEIVREKKRFKLDAIDGLIIALAVLGLSLAVANQEWEHAAYGFKYDLLAPMAFLFTRRVSWSAEFFRRVATALMTVGIIIAVYGFITLLLPRTFFYALGYSDLHSLYLPNGSLAPYQQIGGSGLRRIQSTLSGPNQLGLWLLIPLAVMLTRETWEKKRIAAMTLLAIALLFTFSRSAWIAAAVMSLTWLFLALPRRVSLAVTCALGVLGMLTLIIVGSFAPGIVLRTASSKGHIDRPLEAMATIRTHPLGLGLGSAGPASNRFSDTCVDVEPGSDVSWTKYHPELCLFADGQKIQPTDRACNCPFLTENWYLQIGVELGVLGMLLWIALTMVMLAQMKLEARNSKHEREGAVFLLFLGISVAGLFLHAWEDSAVMMTVWVLAGAFLPRVNSASRTSER